MAKTVTTSTDKPALSAAEKKLARGLKKQESFKKLAIKRVNKTIAALTAVGALANRNSYSYDQEQVNKIFAALNSSVKGVADAFAAPSGTAGVSGFTL